MVRRMLRDHESGLEGANGKVFSSVERKLDPVTLETRPTGSGQGSQNF